MYQRIAIIGISGSGKSIFARALGKTMELPILHMDKLFWKGNWEAVPEAEYIKKQHEFLINNKKWIIEGYIDEALSERLKIADTIIYLDYSGILCAWRVVRRWLKHRKQSRPELPREALEGLDVKFLWVVLTRAERPGIEKALKEINLSKIMRMTSPRATEKIKIGI